MVLIVPSLVIVLLTFSEDLIIGDLDNALVFFSIIFCSLMSFPLWDIQSTVEKWYDGAI